MSSSTYSNTNPAAESFRDRKISFFRHFEVEIERIHEFDAYRSSPGDWFLGSKTGFARHPPRDLGYEIPSVSDTIRPVVNVAHLLQVGDIFIFYFLKHSHTSSSENWHLLTTCRARVADINC